MANLTIVVDDTLLRRARVKAAQLGTSVNSVLREQLVSWLGGVDKRSRSVESLLERSGRLRSGRGGRSWTRDELHER
jgi:plasmid stability protein